MATNKRAAVTARRLTEARIALEEHEKWAREKEAALKEQLRQIQREHAVALDEGWK